MTLEERMTVAESKIDTIEKLFIDKKEQDSKILSKIDHLTMQVSRIESALEGVMGNPGFIATFISFQDHMYAAIDKFEKRIKPIDGLVADMDNIKKAKEWTLKIIAEKVIGWGVVGIGAYVLGHFVK